MREKRREEKGRGERGGEREGKRERGEILDAKRGMVLWQSRADQHNLAWPTKYFAVGRRLEARVFLLSLYFECNRYSILFD